jgi:hypothetical protein
VFLPKISHFFDLTRQIKFYKKEKASIKSDL